MISADLHIHSKHSLDGEFGVKEIIRLYKNAGSGVISLTDHNLVRGITEARVLGSGLGISVIPGIEIDCNYQGIDLHLLGYNINWESSDFADLENQVAVKINDSFSQMVDNLGREGIDVDADEVILKAEGRLPSAELIAEVLLGNEKYRGIEKLAPYRKGGERSDMPYINFYLDFFAQGKPAYVKINYMSYQEAVSMIKENSGVPVIAHPGLNLKGREEVVLELLDNGAEGLEAFNNYHSPEQTGYFAGIARDRKVLLTCGSDFHGKTKPLIKPGAFRTILEFEEYATASVSKLLSF